jgi:linoleoyl-CoA desaturase
MSVLPTHPLPALDLGPSAGTRPSDEPPHRPKFPKDTAGFLTTLRTRVDAYFAHSGRRERDCGRMYLKTAVILAWFAAAYGLLVFAAPAWWLAVPLAVALGVAIAAVGFNIAHDGGHHAYSDRPWVNRLAALSLDLIGASSYLWHWKHGVFHHTYPNVEGQDTDITNEPVARFSPHQTRRWFHRWQHLYLWPAYALTAPRWHLYTDFLEVIRGRIGPHKIPRPKGRDLAAFLLGKVVSIGLLLAVPMFFHPWWVVLLFYLLVTGVAGVVLSVVFQLAHCVGEAGFPLPAGGQMGDAWAAHQVHTTVDFARTSRALTWLLGGLNFQVEHHLFPRVCHVHYPALAVIVEQTCREFGVRYAAHGSFLDGVAAHFRWLRELGRPDSDPGGR